MVDFELRILDPVQQHVHARQVVCRDVVLLPEDLPDAVRTHPVTHVEQE